MDVTRAFSQRSGQRVLPCLSRRQANAGRGVCEGSTELLPTAAAAAGLLAGRSALPMCVTQGCFIAQGNTSTELFLKFIVLNYL